MKLSSRDEIVAVHAKHLEGLRDLLLKVSIIHLASHQLKELKEVDGSVAVNIYDYVLELSL